MHKLVALIEEKHTEEGIEVHPPSTLSEISTFEELVGFSLPDDFKKFYLHCEGFECIEDIFNMTPLSELRIDRDRYGKNWFYFSEYMIYSDMWGLRFVEKGEYEIFNGSYPEKKLTNSLYEFLQRFLKGNVFDPEGLYHWQQELGIDETNN